MRESESDRRRSTGDPIRKVHLKLKLSASKGELKRSLRVNMQ